MKIEIDISSEDALAATLLQLECLHVSEEELPRALILTRTSTKIGRFETLPYTFEYVSCSDDDRVKWCGLDILDRYVKEGIATRVPFDLSDREQLDKLQRVLIGAARQESFSHVTFSLIPYEDRT